MTPHERYLYHQIHPAKLAADWSAGLIALYPLWRHRLTPALTVLLGPPAIASAWVMRFADLEPYRRSSFGRYVAQSMTHKVEAVRLAGMGLMAVGAWRRSPSVIGMGLVTIAGAWLSGVSWWRKASSD